MSYQIDSHRGSHTITWLKGQDDENKLNKSISIQRKEVWDAEKKSNLILSLLLNIPVESLLFEENGDGYNVLDGKQRTLTICAFLKDEFSLSNKMRLKELDGTELVGKKFSELPEAYQRKIMDYELQISFLRPLGVEERALVFFMRNQAVALTKMDLARVLLGQGAADQVSALAHTPFFMTKIKLTEPARRKNEDMQLILQYAILMKGEQAEELSGSAIMSYCDDVKSEETILPIEQGRAVLDYLNSAIPEKRQYLKKVQIPVLMRVATDALAQGIDANTFGQKVEAFFNTIDPASDYMRACTAGSAKRNNVQIRLNALREALL